MPQDSSANILSNALIRAGFKERRRFGRHQSSTRVNDIMFGGNLPRNETSGSSTPKLNRSGTSVFNVSSLVSCGQHSRRLDGPSWPNHHVFWQVRISSSFSVLTLCSSALLISWPSGGMGRKMSDGFVMTSDSFSNRTACLQMRNMSLPSTECWVSKKGEVYRVDAAVISYFY